MERRVILGLSDHGATGINESLRHILRHWHDQGHEVWQLCLGFNGWTSGVTESECPWRHRLLRVNAQNQETRFGQLDIKHALEMTKADVVISSYDVWMVRYMGQPEADPGVAQARPGTLEILNRDSRNFTHIAYFPLDGLYQDKFLAAGLDEAISSFDVPITYSRYAQAGILRDMGLRVPFIPIAHPEIYCPGDRAEARKALNLPQDKFIVGMIATNQYRKRFDEFLEACGKFVKMRDDVLVLPWTTWDVMIHGGFQIPELIYRNGLEKNTIHPQNDVGQLTEEGMVNLYRSLDVCVLTTIGEGAGLPPIRSRACGVPALVSENTSNIEFAAHPFELIPSHITHSDNGACIARFSSDVDALVQKLCYLYDNRDYRDKLGAIGATQMQQYECSRIMPLWDAVLQAIPHAS